MVFLTAHSDAQTAREGMEAGGCAFLTKPYQVEELQAAVAEAVAGHEKRKIHIAISARQSAYGKKEGTVI